MPSAVPPDFLDGHQHVHLFPQVRDAFLKVVAEGAPDSLGQAMRPRAARYDGCMTARR